MNDCIYGIKILSNMILIRFAENDAFMNVLKTHISKNFSSTMNLKQSTFIFYRDGEDLRRKIFLNWMHNLYLKSGSKIDKNMFDTLIKNLKLTICMQIVPKSKVVETVKMFGYFLNSKIMFRTSEPNSPFFAFMKSYFRASGAVIRQDSNSLYIDLKNCDTSVIRKIKRLFTQKVSIGGRNYSLIYNQKEFEKYFFRFNLDENYQDKDSRRRAYSGSDSIETLSDTQKLAQYLKLLGCSENEELSAIKKKYFKLAKEYHPDMHHGKDESIIKVLTEKFIQIKNAYDFVVEMRGIRMAA